MKPKEVVSLLLDDDEIDRKVKSKLIGSERPSGDELPIENQEPSSKSVKPHLKSKKRLHEDRVDKPRVHEESSMLELLSESSLTKRLKLEQDESSNNSYIEGFIDVIGEASDVPDISNTSAYSDGQGTNENSRAPSPIFDFLGEKMGPKRPKRGTGGKRGRPPSTSAKHSSIRGVSNSLGDEGFSKGQSKGLDKLQSIKLTSGSMDQGDRPIKVSFAHLLQGPAVSNIESKTNSVPENDHLLKAKRSNLSPSSSSQSSTNASPSSTPLHPNMSQTGLQK